MIVNKVFILLNVCFFILGTIFPFIDELVIIEFFFLLPILPIYLVVVLFICIIVKQFRKYSLFYIKSLVPIFVFIISQIVSLNVVENIQKYRCQHTIQEIENYKKINGFYPVNLNKSGIIYSSISNEQYHLEFNSSFLSTDIYSSKTKSWKTNKWND